MDYYQVIVVFPSEAEARTMASRLVEQRLAACAQVAGPIHSVFWWEGKVQGADEFLCIAKTTADLYPKVEAAVKQAHSYKVPEILAVPVAAGNPDYLDWLRASVKRP